MSEKNTDETRESPGLRLVRANAARRAAGLPVGRPRGTPNKLTQHIRDGLLYAYDQLGGHAGFATWARKHPAQFYSLMLKSVPKEREANARGTGVQIFIQSADDMRPVIDVAPASVADDEPAP